MREIHTGEVTELVSKLCIDACYNLSADIYNALKESARRESSPLGKSILETLVKNADIAHDREKPMCQDTGMTIVFVELGQEVHIVGGSLTEAINEGVRDGYRRGYLRKSVVNDPILRVNTGDNTPAIIHYDIVPGDKLHIIVSPKGFGSENKSDLRMLQPSDGVEGVKDYVLEVVRHAGPNPCPPTIIGVGIGGNFEECALYAKRALLRPVGDRNPRPHLAAIEEELLRRVNALGIGPAGMGGDTTALDLHVEAGPTHIAGLPVAVNISCHATRHSEGTL